jgi:hypothetical protein
MGSFSEQLLERQVARTQIDVNKLPRTQRKLYQIARTEAEIKSAQELERRKSVFAEAQNKVGSMSLAEYKNYYPQMESWLKEMFSSPELIETKQAEAITTNISKADEQIKRYQNEIAHSQAKIQNYIRDWNNLSSKSKTASARTSYNKSKQDAEKKIEEYNNYINYYFFHITFLL